jgi:lipopolysaccharide exporter
VTWTVLVFAGSKIITFGATLVLARILSPADFGLVAIASVTIGLLALFSDLGLGGALVVRKDLSDRAAGTILTLMLVMGALTAVVIAGAAPLAAEIFGEPDLTPVLAVLGSTVLLSAPTWFYATILQRELEFWRRFKCQMAQSVAYAAVAIGSAIAGAGVWSLVAGQLAGTVVFAGALLLVAPYRVRPTFDREAARETVHEGRGFLAQSGVAFVETKADYMAIGGFLGTAPLGFYSMAFRIAELPYWAVTESVAKVTFPGFARMKHRGEDATSSFLSVLGLVALVACPLGVILSAAADPFTRVIFGAEWEPMIDTLAILAIWGTISHVEASLGWLMNSLGRAGLNAAISAVAVGPLVAAIVLAATYGGIATVAWVMLAHNVVCLLVRMVAADRGLAVPLAGQWRAVRPVIVGSVGAWAAGRAAAEALAGAGPFPALVGSVLAAAVVYAGLASVVNPGILRTATGQLGRILRRRAMPADAPESALTET